MKELKEALQISISILEKRFGNLDSWLEGVSKEQTPEENETDRRQLSYLQGQIDAFQTVLEHITE